MKTDKYLLFRTASGKFNTDFHSALPSENKINGYVLEEQK